MEKLREKDNFVKLFDNGFEIIKVNGDKIISIDFDDIDEIVVYKMDLMTTDLVCFDFKLKATGLIWTIHEERKGYQELIEELPKRLKGFDDKWQEDMTNVPHNVKDKVVYKSQ